MLTKFLFKSKVKTSLLRVSNKSVKGIAFTFNLILDRYLEVFLFYLSKAGKEFEKSE